MPWAMYDIDKAPLHAFHCQADAEVTVPTSFLQGLSAGALVRTQCMEMIRWLTCGNKGARQVGMPRAARTHKQVLNLKGIHRQAGAEMAIAHGQIGASARGPNNNQGALVDRVHNLTCAGEAGGERRRRRCMGILIFAAAFRSAHLHSEALHL